jgi:hypothetical protein
LFNRLVELLIVSCWLVCMTWLVARDAVPRWFAQAPPETATRSWLEEQGDRFQYGIFDSTGGRRGSSWSVYEVHLDTIRRNDLLVLSGLGPIKQLIIETELTFLNETELAAIEVKIKGVPARITLEGERQGPKFGFKLDIGGYPAHNFVLDAQAAQTLCDVTKPFSTLRGLEVGRSWKIHVIDPFSLISSGGRTRLKPVVVRVAAKEEIRIGGRAHDCFVVESPGARAWIDETGRTRRQAVDVPVVGKLEIREEEFRRDKYDTMLRRVRGFSGH